jgi:soluble lytic murein transglycosylase
LTSGTWRKSLWSLTFASVIAAVHAINVAPAVSAPAAEKTSTAKAAKGKKAAKAKTEKPADAKGSKTSAAKDSKESSKTPAAKGKADTSKAAAPAPLTGHSLGALPPAPPPAKPKPSTPRAAQLAVASSASTSAMEIAAVKRALDHVRGGRQSDAGEIRNSISDTVAKKLIDWAMLRSDSSSADFARYVAFIAANPGWPSIVTLRRKAEAQLFQSSPEPATVRAFFGDTKPLSAKGRLALARALLAQGDRNGAAALVREVWRNDALTPDVEARVTSQFGEMLTRADHKARMDRRLYEPDDPDGGVRAATLLGGHEPLIAKARLAMLKKGGDKKALDAVPAAARNDIGYKFARIQMLRRGDHIAEATELMRSVPALDASHDLDEWWVERRLLARKLLDENDAKNAYLVARDATPPSRDNYRAEHQFTAGWIALRYLNDPATALAHFNKVGEGQDNPLALARASYWMGRAAEALKRPHEARAYYEAAARYPTAYYGQIARAKAGLGEIGINPPPARSAEQRARGNQLEVVRAVALLYSVDARDLVNTMMADLGDKCDDIDALVALSDLAAKYEDPRGMLLVGKLALARGYPLDHAAFPTAGLPSYTAIGPEVEPALVYSIARQESWFNPKTVSSANAMGYMQVTPAAGKYIAKKFNVTYDQGRLLNDNVYNLQMGAAELGDVIKDYRGSYILAFVAYNAGRGRVRDWVSRFGDPRDPKVDPIDWVERIPFAETRNYVQRVMENVQVYRARFGGGSRLLIEADLRRGALTN